MKTDIFAQARANAAASVAKAKKTSELPELTDEKAKEHAQVFARAEYLQALIGSLATDAKDKLKQAALRLVLEDGKKKKTRPGSVRVLTPLGQVTAKVATRANNRPVDADTRAKLQKYGVKTTEIVVAEDTFSFNNDALTVPAIQQHIITLFSDPKLQELMVAHGITSELLQFTAGSTQHVITDQSVVELMQSATDGEMARQINDPDSLNEELLKLFDFMVDIKIESAAKPDKSSSVELAKQVLAMFEEKDDTTSPIDGSL